MSNKIYESVNKQREKIAYSCVKKFKEEEITRNIRLSRRPTADSSIPPEENITKYTKLCNAIIHILKHFFKKIGFKIIV